MKYWGCAWYATVQATVDSSLWCHRWHSWDTTWHRRHWVHSWYIIHTGIRHRSRHIVDCISFNPLCKYCMCVCVWEVSVEVSTTQHSIPDTATAALALFSGSCGEKIKRTWCTLFMHAPIFLAYLLCYMKISRISVYLLKGHIQNYIFCETPLGGFEVGNNIALMVTVCIALFKTICELQRETLCQSRHSV